MNERSERSEGERFTEGSGPTGRDRTEGSGVNAVTEPESGVNAVNERRERERRQSQPRTEFTSGGNVSESGVNESEAEGT